MRAVLRSTRSHEPRCHRHRCSFGFGSSGSQSFTRYALRTTKKRSVTSCVSPVVNSLIFPSTSKGRILISIDLSSFGPRKNGTFDHAPRLVTFGFAAANPVTLTTARKVKTIATRNNFIAQGYDANRTVA